MSLLRRRMMMQQQEKLAWYSDSDGVILTQYGTYRLISQSTETGTTWTTVLVWNNNEIWIRIDPSNWSLIYPKNTNFIVEHQKGHVLIYVDDDTREVVVDKEYDSSDFKNLTIKRGAGTLNYAATVNFYVEKI